MITKEKIGEMKKAGAVIISYQTFRKSVVFVQDNEGFTMGYKYKGVIYESHDWLLTYGHEQYERLYNPLS